MEKDTSIQIGVSMYYRWEHSREFHDIQTGAFASICFLEACIDLDLLSLAEALRLHLKSNFRAQYNAYLGTLRGVENAQLN
jgi:hypothetical protein